VRPEPLVDAVVIGDVIAVVAVGGRVERHEPQARHAQVGEVVEALHEAGEVTDSVTVPVHVRLDVEAVDDSGLPPQVGRVGDPHRSPPGSDDAGLAWVGVMGVMAGVVLSRGSSAGCTCSWEAWTRSLSCRSCLSVHPPRRASNHSPHPPPRAAPPAAELPGPAAGGELDLFPEALLLVATSPGVGRHAGEHAGLREQGVVGGLGGLEVVGPGVHMPVPLERTDLVSYDAEPGLDAQGLERVRSIGPTAADECRQAPDQTGVARRRARWWVDAPPDWPGRR